MLSKIILSVFLLSVPAAIRAGSVYVYRETGSNTKEYYGCLQVMDRQGWPGTMVAAVKTEDTNDCTQFKVNDTVDGGYRFQFDGKIMLSPGSGDRSHWVWMDQATRDNWNSPDTLFTPKLQGGNEGSGNAYYVLISGSSNSPIYAANDRGFLNDKGDGFKICVEHIATD